MILRTRQIRPGIATNVELGKLCPMAEILFTRLWMLADREGRLEDDPEKIRVKGLANHPEVTAEAVENLLKSLHDCGLILRYKVRNGRGTPPNSFVSIPTFKLHQRFHPREPQSIIPAPPVSDGAQTNGHAHLGAHQGKPKAQPRTNHAVAICSLSALPSLPSSSAFGGDARAHGSICDSSAVEEHSPPLSAPDTPESRRPVPPRPKAEPPPPPRQQPTPPKPTKTRTALSERRPPNRQAVDMWPHDAHKVGYVRDSLRGLAEVLHMPEPDDWILRQVLDAGRGAPAERIHAVIRGLYQQQRFQTIRSWGLLPVVVAPWFQSPGAG
jgi:hypothetical protein